MLLLQLPQQLHQAGMAIAQPLLLQQLLRPHKVGPFASPTDMACLHSMYPDLQRHKEYDVVVPIFITEPPRMQSWNVMWSGWLS